VRDQQFFAANPFAVFLDSEPEYGAVQHLQYSAHVDSSVGNNRQCLVISTIIVEGRVHANNTVHSRILSIDCKMRCMIFESLFLSFLTLSIVDLSIRIQYLSQSRITPSILLGRAENPSRHANARLNQFLAQSCNARSLSTLVTSNYGISFETHDHPRAARRH
jgi:hypothetical protein